MQLQREPARCAGVRTRSLANIFSCVKVKTRLQRTAHVPHRQRQRHPPPPPRRRASTTPSKLFRNSQQSAFSVTETLDELRGIDGGVEVVVRIEVHYRGQ